MSTARAPGRVNLIGEHTDYNEGFALPFAIAHGCTAVARHAGALTRGTLTVRSAQRPEPVTVDELRPDASWITGPSGWAAYAAGVIWALAACGHVPEPVTGIAIDLDSDVPMGVGLSSSAAVTCAVTQAVSGLLDLGLSGRDIAAVATRSETEFVGAPTGGMDQLASAQGEPGHALFCDMRSLRTEAVAFDPAAEGLAVLVADTRAEHRLVDGGYRERRQSCAVAAAELGVPALRDITLDDLDHALRRLSSDRLRRRVRHVVTENARVLEAVRVLRSGSVRELGPLLVASQRSMADDFEITVPEVDTAARALMDAGALGARLTGGGFGGCVIALVDQARAEPSARAVEVAFAARGFTPPACFTVTPGRGAHRTD